MKLIINFILMIAIGVSYAIQAYALVSNKQSNLTFPVVHIQAEQDHEIIVLIHGLLRSSSSMNSLKTFLESRGYQTFLYNYPSTRYDIQDHGIYLQRFIKNILAKNPGVRIHFITHSLGGIITREAISKLNPSQLKNIGYLIMLAPPNQGSFLATLLTKLFPPLSSSIKPLAELSSDQSSYIHRVPIPNIKMGIIAGRFDAKVPPSAARLQGQIDLVVINSTHTFIMNNPNARKLIINFLVKGTFNA